jgi:hypothetical protein
MHKTRGAVLVLGMLAISLPAFAADEPKPDKSQYNLFNPTPVDQMRELAPDRPDTTEEPRTIDAGHYQIEFSFADYNFDRRNKERQTAKTLSVLPMLLKVGLLDNVDLQLGVNPFVWERTRDRASGEAQEARGLADSEMRLKINVWGNESGKTWETAFAVMPWVGMPTGTGGLSADHVEGGLILPLSIELPLDFSLATMVEVDFLHSEDQGGRTVVDFVHSASLGHQIYGDLNGFVEYAGFASFKHDHQYQGYLDFGLTYQIGKNVQVDGGMRVGLTPAADDVGFYSGITLRF